jgi:hypothetical protein
MHHPFADSSARTWLQSLYRRAKADMARTRRPAADALTAVAAPATGTSDGEPAPPDGEGVKAGPGAKVMLGAA